MFARPDSVIPAKVCLQSAKLGLSGRSPHAFTMLLQELATGEVSGDGSGVMVTLAGWVPLAAWYSPFLARGGSAQADMSA